MVGTESESEIEKAENVDEMVAMLGPLPYRARPRKTSLATFVKNNSCGSGPSRPWLRASCQ